MSVLVSDILLSSLFRVEYESSYKIRTARAASLDHRHDPIHSHVGSTEKKAGGRRGTRSPCEIPIALVSADPAKPLSGTGLVILVNPQGCAIRFGQPLTVGTTVRLERLPRGGSARVVNCISMGRYEKLWLLGLALEEPGNVWGIQSPPEDWTQ